MSVQPQGQVEAKVDEGVGFRDAYALAEEAGSTGSSPGALGATQVLQL